MAICTCTPANTLDQTDVSTPANTLDQTDVSTPANTLDQTDVSTPANTLDQTDVSTPANTLDQTDVSTPANTLFRKKKRHQFNKFRTVLRYVYGGTPGNCNYLIKQKVFELVQYWVLKVLKVWCLCSRCAGPARMLSTASVRRAAATRPTAPGTTLTGASRTHAIQLTPV